jgi:flagellar assembly protein FliH
VKSRDVEVSMPCMVDNNKEFQEMHTCLAVLNVETKNYHAASPKSLGWVDTAMGTKEQGKAAMLLAETNNSAAKILAAADKKAAKILAAANEKAAMILKNAEKSAQEMRAQTEAEYARLRKEVIETTRAEVYPQAKAEGYQEGRQAGEAEGKCAFQNAERLFRLAQRALQEEYAKVDKDLLHLAIKIAERIVRAYLTVEPERLSVIIQAVTLLPKERRGWKLHVAPDDACWLEKNQPPCPCPWVIDESLSPGDCFLECQEGYFDARLETQLNKLEHTLREELKHGDVGPIEAGG